MTAPRDFTFPDPERPSDRLAFPPEYWDDAPRSHMMAAAAIQEEWMAKIERGEITEYDRANWPPRWVR